MEILNIFFARDYNHWAPLTPDPKIKNKELLSIIGQDKTSNNEQFKF